MLQKIREQLGKRWIEIASIANVIIILVLAFLPFWRFLPINIGLYYAFYYPFTPYLFYSSLLFLAIMLSGIFLGIRSKSRYIAIGILFLFWVWIEYSIMSCPLHMGLLDYSVGLCSFGFGL